jgi:hypothetical protein
MRPALTALFILFTIGCSRHAAPTATKSSKPEAPSGNMTGLLTGVWRLDKIEAPDMMDKMSSFGSQAERDAMLQGISKYQDAMKGLKVTFSKDSTYESAYNGQSDIGTWRVKRQEIETVSKLSGTVNVFQIVSANNTTLIVKYNPGDAMLLMTFIKQ